MDSAEIPNPSPDATTNPAAADPSSSPPLPPRKRRLSPSPSPRRSASRSRSPPLPLPARPPLPLPLPLPHSLPQPQPAVPARWQASAPQQPQRRDVPRLPARQVHPLRPRVQIRAPAPFRLRRQGEQGDGVRGFAEEQLLPGEDMPLLPPASAYPGICRDFARGKCSRSANECRFMPIHLLKSLQQEHDLFLTDYPHHWHALILKRTLKINFTKPTTGDQKLQQSC
ncbi:hypothetical protein PVAP13_7KG110000 [Panicum virgatum]|uniref:C3H1-type domain-containing protein n=1 Tax=Panicum virgatum TaxID=38727 RepID=A0A8T0QFX7_PANVG|nr:hypothetical protein PVAP13_7KG110000 [Panicum virgatum]